MICPKCGIEVKDTAKFCGICGAVIILPQSTHAVMEHSEVSGEKNSQTKKSKKLTGIIAAAVLGVLIIAGIAGGIWYNIYENSNARKTEKTIQYILEDKLNSARELLGTFDAENEDVLNDYMEVLDKRDLFVARFDPSLSVQINQSSVIDARDDFSAALKSFCKEHNPSELPAKLSEQFEYYTKKLSEIDDFVQGILKSVSNSQKVFLNEVICNRYNNFTLSEIQANVDISNSGISKIMKKLRSDDIPVNWSDTSNSKTTAARRLISDFENSVKQQIEFCETDIKKNLDLGYSMDDELYRKKADPNYFSFICGDLENVVTDSDIETNTLIYRNTLICSFSASVIADFS